MNYLCTLSDYKYLPSGFALITSLSKLFSSEFTLYYLCLDDETYDRLDGYNENVVPIKLEDVEKDNLPLLVFKEQKPYQEYCWALASSFCKYLFDKKNIDHVLYVDADIFFYHDPQLVFDEVGDKSIGIIRHRHNTSTSPDGEFNVGIVYFKNNSIGNPCLQWWCDCILKETRPDLQTCGDQKYLEEFIPMYGDEVSIIDENLSYGAPWNFRLYVYDNWQKNGTVIWGDKEQPLVFVHFSRLNNDFANGNFTPTSGQYPDHTLNFQVFQIPVVKFIYFEYVALVRRLWGTKNSSQWMTSRGPWNG